MKNIEVEDFLILLNNSKCIVGNSSVGIRESSYLGVPSVNIGLRQNGREKAKNVTDTKDISRNIFKSINFQIKRDINHQDYMVMGTVQKMLKILHKMKIS